MKQVNKEFYYDVLNGINQLVEYCNGIDKKYITEPFLCEIDQEQCSDVLRFKFGNNLISIHFRKYKDGTYNLGILEWITRETKGWYTAMISTIRTVENDVKDIPEILKDMLETIEQHVEHNMNLKYRLA